MVTNYHVGVVDALVGPDKMAGHAYGDIYKPADGGINFGLTEFSAFRVDLAAAVKPGVVQEVRLPCGEVEPIRQPAAQHERAVLLIPKPAKAMGPDMATFFLVDPGPTFYMVEPRQHVFRDTRDCGWGSKRAIKVSKLMDEELDAFSTSTFAAPLPLSKVAWCTVRSVLSLRTQMV